MITDHPVHYGVAAFFIGVSVGLACMGLPIASGVTFCLGIFCIFAARKLR